MNTDMLSSARTLQHTDVAIIGAGLAGLTAARLLVASGLHVVVLEARNRVGGRTATQICDDGTILDVGGQWIGPGQTRVTALAASLGLHTIRTYDEGKNIEYHQGRRITYAGPIPKSRLLVALEAALAMSRLNRLALLVPPDAPWHAPRAIEWDTQTFTSWINRSIILKGTRQLLHLATQAIFSCEPHELSLLHVLFYIRSTGSLDTLVRVTHGAQEQRFSEGAQTLAHRMAQELGNRVVLETPVHGIIGDASEVRVESEKLTVIAQKVIIALPPILAGRLHYEPALPKSREQLNLQIPMGVVIKFHCLYPTSFWREQGLSGQATSDEGPVRITFDNSPATGSPGILLGFLEGDDGRFWSKKPLEERRTAVLSCLARYFGNKAQTPLAYVEQDWAAEEHSGGCYAGYFPPGVWTQYGEALRKPFGHLHWAGTETATQWNGYMEGAIQSGERAAQEVQEALASRKKGHKAAEGEFL